MIETVIYEKPDKDGLCKFKRHKTNKEVFDELEEHLNKKFKNFDEDIDLSFDKWENKWENEVDGFVSVYVQNGTEAYRIYIDFVKDAKNTSFANIKIWSFENALKVSNYITELFLK